MKNKSSLQYLINNFVEFLLSIVGILLLGSIPSLFIGMKINVGNYVSQLEEIFSKLFGSESLVYSNGYTTRPLFPQILHHYKETMLLFFISFLCSILISIIITSLYFNINNKMKKKVRSLVFLLNGIPDIILIIISQLIVIHIFKITGIEMANVASSYDDRAIFLPIIILCIPTSLMYIKFFIFRCEEQSNNYYVIFSKSKGLNDTYIFFIHILRNIFFSAFQFIKSNIWFVFSNLYIIEYFFAIPGIFSFIKTYPTVEVFTVGLLLLYIPIYLIYKSINIIIPSIWGGVR